MTTIVQPAAFLTAFAVCSMQLMISWWFALASCEADSTTKSLENTRTLHDACAKSLSVFNILQPGTILEAISAKLVGLVQPKHGYVGRVRSSPKICKSIRPRSAGFQLRLSPSRTKAVTRRRSFLQKVSHACQSDLAHYCEFLPTVRFLERRGFRRIRS